jgi:hypothetical protein
MNKVHPVILISASQMTITDRNMDVKREKSKDSRQKTESSPRQPGAQRPREIGGPKGPEPTRYGDWERRGRCIDF